MTSEQIAELRKLDTLPPGPERRLAVYEAAVNFMPRLLDEREALLDAMTRLEVWVTKHVSAPFETAHPEAAIIPELALARQVLDKVCSP